MTENNTVSLVSFTFDELLKDVNYDRIFLFILSYEFKLNFNQIMTLFQFSTDIFWTYINTLRPLLKLGDRKASTIKQAARKVYFKLLGSNVELNAKEQEYLVYLTQYIKDSFTDGIECIHFSNIKDFPVIARGNFQLSNRETKDVIEIGTPEELYQRIDEIEAIGYKGQTFFKTSRVDYLIEKYYGELNSREIRRKNVREIIDMMDSNAIQAYNQDLMNKYNALFQHRMELVYRHEKVENTRAHR